VGLNTRLQKERQRQLLSRRDLVAAGGGLLMFSGAWLLEGCGGAGVRGGGATTFSSAGKVTFTKTATVTASGASITDTAGLASISVPAGAMPSGATVRLDEFSGQRALVQLTNFNATEVAVDITVVPAQLGGNAILVNMTGPGGDDANVILAAFAANGNCLALPETSASTSSAMQGSLSANLIAAITGVSPTSNSPVTIQVVVESIQASALAVPAPAPAKPTKVTHPATKYASRKRIGITIHGIMSDASSMQPVLQLFSQPMPTDGLESEKSLPFDETANFVYTWAQPIETSAAQFASFINQNYGDATAYDVHIIAHSMGGLVSRYAIENIGCPTVSQLITIATSHLGVPVQIVKTLIVNFSKIGSFVDAVFSSFVPGVNQLIEGSSVLNTLKANPPATGVLYQAVAGTKTDLTVGPVPVGQFSDAYYKMIGAAPDDGIVPLYSAEGGPAQAPFTVVGFNHDFLVRHIDQYWTTSTCSTWIAGMNRRIKTLKYSSAQISLDIGVQGSYGLTAYDKDGDQLSSSLLFASSNNPVQPQLKWKIQDTTVASVVSSSDLEVTLEGLKTGSTNLEVTDPLAGATFTVPVVVAAATLILTPSNPSVSPGSTEAFNVALPSGFTVTKGSTLQYTWSQSGGNDCTLNDGHGVSGATSIQTSSADVNLVSTSGQTGTVILSVSAYEVAGSTKTLLGTASTQVSFGNPFQGTWNGPYTAEVNPPEQGTMTWNISSSGQISGTGYNTSIGFTFQINGAITAKGVLSGTIDSGRNMGGTLSINSAGQLVGNVLSIYSDGSSYVNEIDFTKE